MSFARRPFTAVRNLAGEHRRPIWVSILASLWVWFALSSPARQRARLLESKILETRTLLGETRQEESRLRTVKRRLPLLERELRARRERLWPAGESFLSHVDKTAVATGVQIGRLRPVAREGVEDGARSWNCDVEGSFESLVDFLEEMSRCKRTVDIRELTIQPASTTLKSAQQLRLSLLLLAPSTEDLNP